MRSNLKKYCVIGYPIKHSLSSKIFNRAFRRMKISAQYSAVEVAPQDLAKFMQGFRGKYVGANVTIPHKEKILRFLDKLSPEAKKIGAVNVIVNKGGKLIGHNTDVFGAMIALKNLTKKLRGKNAIVLGAGGAARAIVYGLKKAGAKVTVLNRTISRAKKLAQDFKLSGAGNRGYGSPKDLDPAQCDILINATSVGMWPQKAQTPLPNFSTFFNSHPSPLIPHPLIVMDIIYRPRMTQFLRDAKHAGCRIITGDKMFLAQAAKSFELWTGKKMP